MAPRKSPKSSAGGGDWRKKSHLPRVFALLALVIAVGGGLYLARGYFVARDADREVTDLLEQAQELLYLKHEPSEAVQRLRRASQLEPRRWQVHYEMGVAYLELNQLSKAIEALDRALVRCPAQENSLVHLKVGKAHNRRHEATGSEQDLRRAVTSYASASRDPRFAAESLHALGMLHLLRANTDLPMARNYLKQVVEGYPDYEGIELAREVLEGLEKMLEEEAE